MAVGYTKLKDFKGVNFTDPATEISEDEFTMARNCWGGKRGYVGPRQVQRMAEKQFNSGTGLYDRVTKIDWLPWDSGANPAAFGAGLYQFIDSEQKHRVVACLPFEWPTGAAGSGPVQYDPMMVFLHTTQSGFYFPNSDPAIIWRHDATFSSAIGRYFPRLNGAPSRPVSLVFNNELYLFLGHTVAGLVIGSKDFPDINTAPKFRRLGEAWTTGAGTVGDQFKFAFGDVYRNVFALGGLPAPYESVIAWTETGDTPDVLVEVAKWTGVGYGDGDKLIRVKTAPIVGGSDAVEPYVMAFKSRSVWLLQGFPPSSTGPGDMRMTPIMRREGLVAPHAVCETPYGLVWCSGRNVWLMPPGTEPKPIGDKIKGLLETLPQAPVDSWFMEFHDDVLYLNFPSPRGIVDGNEFGGAGGAATSRKYLPSQQLWCDLRKPDEPRWWGPMDVRCAHMLSLNIPNGPKQLGGLTPYWKATTDYVVQPFTMADEGNDSQDDATGAVSSLGLDLADPGNVHNGPTWTVDGSQQGDSIVCSTMQVLKTREMDFGDDSLEKIIERIEVNAYWGLGLNRTGSASAWTATDLPLLLGWVANGGRAVNTAAGPAAGAAAFGSTSPSSTGFVLDETTLDVAPQVRLSETFIPLPFFPADGSRFLARSLQLALLGTQVLTTVPGTNNDHYLTRKFTVKSITVSVRPIGRRPGGSYGG